MRKLRTLGIVCSILVAAAVMHACEKSVEEVETSDDALNLKSASASKVSYIITLNDPQLNAELSKTAGYSKKKEKVSATVARLLKKLDVTDGEIGYVYATALQGFSIKIPPGQLKKMEGESSIALIEEDQVISLSPIKAYRGKPNGGGSSTPPAQETPWGITRVNGGVDGTGKTVWIIDTGVDFDHPDLKVDAARAANFTSDKEGDDLNGHGTHVAGTIAALNNGFGVIGVAAGATVVPVKVLNRRGSGTVSGVVAGVDYVADNAANGDVANMSLGGGGSTTLDNAVIAAATSGVKFALAAGNESDDANKHSPARANHANIYTVSAMDINDKFAYFSNYGNPPIDYCEPGYSIYSTYKDGGYATLSGTSMAAPHMAGILALGSVKSDGFVTSDLDDNPDLIGVH